jgi:hypothetical protein
VAELASPRAVRMTAPRWLDARLALGVLLVLVSIVAGARIFASADTLTGVYVAAHDLVPGQHLTSADLDVTRVRLPAAGGRYIAAGAAPPVGYVVTRYVGAGELVPLGAVSAGAATTRSRLVTVPVQSGHLADALQRGDLVDVYVTAKAAAGAAVPAPTLVLAGVPVESRDGGSRSFSGTSQLAVVLAVPVDQVAALVHAVESGTIDLVTVPPAAAAAVSPATSGS